MTGTALQQMLRRSENFLASRGVDSTQLCFGGGTMEQSLLKASVGMHVGYANGGFSNNLRGKNFKLVERSGSPCLRIDMSGNTHVRNKQQNSCIDALELLEHKENLAHVQVMDADLVHDFFKRAKNAELTGRGCRLELDFAERGALLYSISKVEFRSGAYFDVSLDIEKAATAGS